MAENVVFGASGGIGNAVVRALAAQGKEVLGVNRSGKAIVPDGVQVMGIDAQNLDAVRKATDGAKIIYNCLHPLVQDAIIEAASETGATVVLATTCYMYDPKQGPMKETSPHVYGKREGGKFYAEMADQLLAAHQAGKLKGAVARASDIYGPNVRHGVGSDQLFGPVMAGKPANFLGNPDVEHGYTYSEDCAQALITLGENEQAHGEIWHVPTAPPIKPRELYDMIFKEMGVESSLRVADGFLLTMLALFSSEMRKLKTEKAYQFQTRWEVDYSKYDAAFGAQVTPYAQGVKETVAWFKEHPPA